MATTTSKLTSVATNRIGINPALNACRVLRALFACAIPEVLEYARKMTEIGYKQDEPVSGEPVDKGIGKELAILRQTAFDALDGMKDVIVHALGEKWTVTCNDLRESARRTFGDDKGNFAVPSIRLIAGYTRMSAAIVLANAVRAKAGLDLILEVPMVLYDKTLSDAERKAVNVQENSYGGKESIPFGQILEISKGFVADELNTVSDACRLMGKCPQKDSAFRQRIGTMLELDASYPEVDVIGRFARGEIGHGESKYSHAKVTKWLNADKETGLFANGKSDKPSDEEVLAFLCDPSKKNGSEVTPLTPKQMGKARKHTKNPAKQEVIDAILKGDSEALKKFETCPEGYALCHKLIQQGHGEAVIAALKPIALEVHNAS